MLVIWKNVSERFFQTFPLFISFKNRLIFLEKFFGSQCLFEFRSKTKIVIFKIEMD